ncbi:MAG: glucosaminidase domain-containing protein [Bacteroidota bacterium]
MKRIFLYLGIVLCIQVEAQKLSAEQYIAQYAPTAVSEMKRSGIPASITLAQGLLESSNGNSPLACVANNHFGIKCHNEWTGQTFYMDDDEKNECFRHYTNACTSYADHTDFLMTRSRYAFLFEYDHTDYVNWAKGLKQAGYATNPQYPTLLINLIERYSLAKYDSDVSMSNNVEKKEAEDIKVVAKENNNELKNSSSPNFIPFNEEIVVPVEEFFGNIFLVNNTKTVIANKGDTPLGIANKYNVPLNYLYLYNDMIEGQSLEVGTYVYLQPKRNKGFAKYHKVKYGETMYSISQSYGIKLKDLYEKNQMLKWEEPLAGEIIYMREVNENKPKLASAIQSNEQLTPTKTIPSKSTLSAKEIEYKIAEKTNPVVITESTSNTQSIVVKESPKNLEIKSPQTNITSNTTNNNIEEEKVISKTTVKSYVVQTGDTLYNISKRYGVSIEDLTKWNNIINNSISLGQTLILSQ